MAFYPQVQYDIFYICKMQKNIFRKLSFGEAGKLIKSAGNSSPFLRDRIHYGETVAPATQTEA
jgi:hypothetical protein